MAVNNLLAIILVVEVVCGSLALKCHMDATIDITNGKRNGNKIIENGTVYSLNDYYESEGIIFGCICNVKECIRKCCPSTKSMFFAGKCVKNDTFQEFTVQVFDKTEYKGDGNFYYVPKLRCLKKQNYIPDRNPEQKFFVQKDGSLYISNADTFVESERYCVENIINSTDSLPELIARVCSEEETISEYIATIGMIISMPFLLATFLVYAFLPDRNLPAKALMCYVLSLLFAYILLVTIQLDSNHSNSTCITLAFFCYFFFMASFFWMNASCLDIFFTFSGMRGLLGERKKENRRFMYYSAYAWGVPIVLVGFAAIFTFGEIERTNSPFYTGLGNGQCWFRSGWPTGIYFYFPIATLLIINIVLFGVTTYKIKKVQRDTKMLKNVDSRKHKYDNNDKQRFNLYVKLLFAMGINWSMEVISWAVLWKWAMVPDYIWILTDFCNAVYGVFIFFIFVFKRNIWKLLKKRYLQLTGRPQQAHTLTSTHRTTLTASLHSLSKSLERNITPCFRCDENDKHNGLDERGNQRALIH